MSTVNIWLVLTDTALQEFKARRTAEREEAEYTGAMDDKTYSILSAVAAFDSLERLFVSPEIGGKNYTLFSLYVEGEAKVKTALDYLVATWPTHILVFGAWWLDGRQVGTQFTYATETDAEGNEYQVIDGVVGTPLYPIHAQVWRLMPDVVVYNEDGDEASRTSATSNADLRDINRLAGNQAPRRFE